MAVCRSSLRLIAALSIALTATAGFAQSTVTLNATSGTGTIATNYTTTGGLTVNMGFFAEYLVLAGGGGGGVSANDSTAWGSGGGGAGGLRTGTTALSSMSYFVQVGGGGAGGQMSATAASQRASSGAGSFLGGISATAGGAGGRFKEAGISAGSGGGGGGRASASGGAGNVPATTPSQGNDGGDARADDIGGQSAGGGGGGAGAAGGNAGPTSSIAGNGGNGLASLITGSSVTYGGGGGGGAWNTGGSETAGTGGTGGGGAGSTSGNATAGTDGLGGGGGGAGTNGTGGQGGAGVVIVRYQGESLGNIGGSVTPGTGSAAGYTLHTFSTGGTTTSTSALNLSGVNMNARLGAVLTGTISGDGGLTYNGPGTLTLAAANTYSGPTVVSGGTLAVGPGGSIANSGTTMVVGGNLAGDASANGLNGSLVIDGGSVSARDVFIGNSKIAPRSAIGVLNVSSGTLSVTNQLGVGVSSNYSGTGTLNIFGGGVVDVRGRLDFATTSTINISAGGTLKVGGNVTGGNVFGQPGDPNPFVNDGAIIFNGDSDQILSGTMTGSGAVVVGARRLAIGSSGAIGSTGGVTILPGKILQAAFRAQGYGPISGDIVNNGSLILSAVGLSGTFPGSISGTGQFTTGDFLLYVGSVTLTGNNTFTGTTSLLGGTLSVGDGGTSGSLTAGISLANASSLIFNRSDSISYSSNITGKGSLTKLGSGALTLSGSNSFTGQTTVSEGTLILHSANALAPTAAVVVASGATLQAIQPIRIGYLDSAGTVTGSNNLTATHTVTRSGNIGGIANGTDSQGTFAAGIVKLGTGTSTVNATNTYTGLTWVREGTLAVGSANAFAAASDLTVDSGATFDRAGFSQTVANADLVGSVGNTGGGGLLTVTGTLSGSGLVNGDVTVTGVHAPGNSPGIQTFDGDLSYGSGAVVNWELIDNTQSNSPVVYDQIVLSSAANLSFSGSNVLALSFAGSGSLVNWADSFWDVNRAWTVFDLASGVTTGFNNLSLGGSLLDSNGLALDASRGSFSLSEVGEDVVLVFMAVPEPSMLALTLAGLASVGCLVRRRRRNIE